MSILQRPDATLFYELSGIGAPILLIQGVGVAGECWRPQVLELKREFQTLIYDNRGLGSSTPCRGPITIEAMADDARALIEEAGWDSAHVVGHSMGGVIAHQLALQAPGRVRSLSLLCTFPRGKDAARLTPWVLWMTLRIHFGSRRMRRRAFLEMLFPEKVLGCEDTDTCAERLRPLLGRELADQPPIVMKQIRALGRHDQQQRLGELAAIPTLVLSAAEDPIALPCYGRALAQAIPGAHFEEWPDVSHGVTLQEPVRISQRLSEFIQEAERCRSRSECTVPKD